MQAAFNLTAWYSASAEHIEDLDLTSPQAFKTARNVVEKFGLDLSDAFQIVSVRDGYFARLINDSQTVLVTADKNLAAAARAEQLRVWSVMEEDPPE